MRTALPVGLAAIALLFVGCGGGGGGGNGVPPAPDVALLVVAGHAPLDPDYLGPTADAIETALEGAGWSVATTRWVDELSNGSPGGWQELVQELRRIRDDWVVGAAEPTRVVIVGHSHGCVRTHAALRAVPDLPVRLLVDLDGSSVGWTLLHGSESAAMGGAPEDAYMIPVQVLCPAYPAVPSAPPPFDLEDVVFDGVAEAFEVRSGDVILDPNDLPNLVEYDERWNARPDTSTTGLTCFWSGTSHGEVAQPGGTTLPLVIAWILDRLGPP